MRPASALRLACLIVLGTLLVRSLHPRGRRAPSPEPVKHPEPVTRAGPELPLSAEDAARIASAWPALTPYVSTRTQ